MNVATSLHWIYSQALQEMNYMASVYVLSYAHMTSDVVDNQWAPQIYVSTLQWINVHC